MHFSGKKMISGGWRTFPENTACHRAINSRKNWPHRGKKKVGVAADELCSFLFASGLLTISRPDFFSFSSSLSLSNAKLDEAAWRRFPNLWTKILQRTRDNSQCVLHDNRECYAYGGIKRFAVSYNPLYKPLMMQCEAGNGITR